MSLKLKALKKVTKVAAPVERTVKWVVELVDENLEFIREATGKSDLSLGDVEELEAQVFIKRLSYEDIDETAKAYNFKLDYQNPENSKLLNIDTRLLRAARLLGSVCEDAKATKFFESIEDIYCSDPLFIDALYEVADGVNNFSGKSRTSNSEKMSSGANSSLTELVDEPSQKLSET